MEVLNCNNLNTSMENKLCLKIQEGYNFKSDFLKKGIFNFDSLLCHWVYETQSCAEASIFQYSVRINVCMELITIKHLTLADVAQKIECQPANQKVAGLIPSQGTGLGCRPGLHWETCERQPHIDVSLPLFLPPFPCL